MYITSLWQCAQQNRAHSWSSSMSRMKVILTTVWLLLFALANGKPQPVALPDGTPVAVAYDNKFDNVDIDEILSQKRLLNNYVKCLEGTGRCTPDGRMLKEILPDAILTDCTKCTEKQKYGAEKVTRHLIDNRPKDWERLEKLYDPQGSYRIKYQQSVNNNNSNNDKNTK